MVVGCVCRTICLIEDYISDIVCQIIIGYINRCRTNGGLWSINGSATERNAGVRTTTTSFVEGNINYVEAEGDDLKVDITYDKVGHKRLMAKYAGLEIID